VAANENIEKNTDCGQKHTKDTTTTDKVDISESIPHTKSQEKNNSNSEDIDYFEKTKAQIELKENTTKDILSKENVENQENKEKDKSIKQNDKIPIDTDVVELLDSDSEDEEKIKSIENNNKKRKITENTPKDYDKILHSNEQA